MLSFKRKYCVFILSIYATCSQGMKSDDNRKKDWVRLIEIILMIFICFFSKGVDLNYNSLSSWHKNYC